MEKINKHLALLGVELMEISTQFIYKLRQAHANPETAFDYLPEYTLNDKGNIVTAKYYHQFVGLFDAEENKKYLYFNLKTLDYMLQNEISNCGFEDIFEKNLEFKNSLSNFTPENEGNITNFIFPNTNYLVVELTYETQYDYFGGGYDCDLNIDIIGYLNNSLQIQYFQ